MPTILTFLRTLLRPDGKSRSMHPPMRDDRTGETHDRRLLLYFGRGIGGTPYESRRKQY